MSNTVTTKSLYHCSGKRKRTTDEENFNDFHIDLRSATATARTPRSTPGNAEITPGKIKNGTVRSLEVYDNIGLDEFSVRKTTNYFQDGVQSEAIKEALENLKDNQLGGAGNGVKMREKPPYPMRAISAKSRISVGPVLMEDDNPSTQNIYDKVYTHNTFKHGK